MAETAKVTVAVGGDHGGYQLKDEIKGHLTGKGYTVIDCGTHSKDPVDYPAIAYAVAEKVSNGTARFGIIVDGAGIGSCMAANKVKGVRAALCYDLSSANNAREHNNANILTLGSGLIGSALALHIVNTFLTVECTAERHLKRVAMIDRLGSGTPPALSVTPNQPALKKEEPSVDISNDDILRIAEQIRIMMATRQVTGALAGTCAEGSCHNCGQCASKTPGSVRDFIGYGADRVSHQFGGKAVPKDIAQYIDHTLLRADASQKDIAKLCGEAREYGFASVCVNPVWVAFAARELAGTKVKVCTVIGFPLGTHLPEIKAMEARRAIRDGAKEIDMVINIGALKGADYDLVYRDILAVTEACEDGNALSKVIIETSLLTDAEKVKACELSVKARADFVKTSTGFSTGGATAKDVALMAGVVSKAGVEVKASGGVKSFDDAKAMIAAGATRLGASAGIKIVQAAKGMTVSEGGSGY